MYRVSRVLEPDYILIFAACPPLAVSPFRRKILDQEVIELGAKLSRTEVIDLCGELSTPVSVVRRLTYVKETFGTHAESQNF